MKKFQELMDDYKALRYFVGFITVVFAVILCLPFIVFGLLIALIRWDYYWFDKIVATAFGIVIEAFFEPTPPSNPKRKK